MSKKSKIFRKQKMWESHLSAKKVIIIGLFLVAAAFVLSACGGQKNEVLTVPVDVGVDDDTSAANEGDDAEMEVVESVSCESNSECSDGQSCIDSVCGVLTDHYNSSCDTTCTLKEVVLTTSDGAEQTMTPGKGSYTAAGALTWTVGIPPAYCGDDVVPFTIGRTYYGEDVGGEVTLVADGETSRTLTHPNMDSVQFTISVNSVTTECSS